MFRRLFLDHPGSLEESYFEHQRKALTFAGWMLLASVACVVHGVVPGICGMTAGRILFRLHDRMLINRGPAAARPPAA